MCMNTFDPRELNEAIRRLVEEFHPEYITLFGSYAWGNPHDDSDIDLWIVVPTSDQPPHERARRGYRVLRGISLPIEVHVRTHAEAERYQHVPASLEHLVQRKGVAVYVR